MNTTHENIDPVDGMTTADALREHMASQVEATDNNSVQVGFAEQHNRDSAELRRVCQARDIARKEVRERDVEIAWLRDLLTNAASVLDNSAEAIKEAEGCPLMQHESASMADYIRAALTQQEQEHGSV